MTFAPAEIDAPLQLVSGRPTWRPMALRVFAFLLAALALFAAPLAMSGSVGAAMAHAPSLETSAHESHCGGSDETPDDQSSGTMISCVAACSAVPAAAPLLGPQMTLGESKVRAVQPQLFSGVNPEGETPPPRIAPEI